MGFSSFTVYIHRPYQALFRKSGEERIWKTPQMLELMHIGASLLPYYMRTFPFSLVAIVIMPCPSYNHFCVVQRQCQCLAECSSALLPLMNMPAINTRTHARAHAHTHARTCMHIRRFSPSRLASTKHFVPQKRTGIIMQQSCSKDDRNFKYHVHLL